MYGSKRGQDFQRWNSKWALWIPPRDSIPPNAGSRPPCGKWVFCVLSVVRRDRRKLAFFEGLPCECRHWAEYFTCLITLTPQRSHEMATIIPISQMKKLRLRGVFCLGCSALAESKSKSKAISLYIIQSCLLGFSEINDSFKIVFRLFCSLEEGRRRKK